ncbi:MAG TPA: ABC transporter substrate-binding protein [Acholeplasma sp.]|nr:ABC transporter substrate-binding protein [Acholeplasma sp.]
MKKILSVLVLVLFGVLLVSCNTKSEKDINVGVSFYPMKDILHLIEDDVKEAGYNLVINEFSDYQTVNNSLLHGELDANMIQHEYFLNAFNSANNANLKIVAPIYHATFALYSKDYDSLDEIPNGATITLPDDATNLSRAIYLLAQAELITLKGDKTTELTLDDIETNPKELDLTDQVPLTTLANRYLETELAIMYPTYARSLNLEGNAERLYVEKQDDVTPGYAISIAVSNEDKDSAKIKLLIDLVQTEKVRQFLIENYSWASSPAF